MPSKLRRRLSDAGRVERCGNIAELRALARRRVPGVVFDYVDGAAGDEDAILARFRRFADAGVTDLSVRLLPIGDNRDELIASKRRTREVIAALGAQVR